MDALAATVGLLLSAILIGLLLGLRACFSAKFKVHFQPFQLDLVPVDSIDSTFCLPLLGLQLLAVVTQV